MGIEKRRIEETILYEDKDILVCRKPGGLAIQTRRIGMLDMESMLRNYLAAKGEDPYLAVVHRLDQPVQGILVFGKNRKSGARLSEEMQRNGKNLSGLCPGSSGEKGRNTGRSDGEDSGKQFVQNR